MSTRDRSPKTPMTAAFLMVLLLAGPAVAGSQPDEEPEIVQVLKLDHLDTKTGVIVLRSIFDVLNLAEMPDRGIIVFRETAVTVDAVMDLMKQIDVPVEGPATEKVAHLAVQETRP